MAGFFWIDSRMRPSGLRTQIASCVSLYACVLPRNESCGAPFSSTYETTIGFSVSNAVLTARCISSDNLSSVRIGGALIELLLGVGRVRDDDSIAKFTTKPMPEVGNRNCLAARHLREDLGKARESRVAGVRRAQRGLRAREALERMTPATRVPLTVSSRIGAVAPGPPRSIP